MIPTAKTPQKIIISSQYFLYFGILGVYLPYFNLYCYHLGFSGFEIGTLAASRSMMLIIFPMVWGSLADRFHWRRPLYVACNALSTMVWVGYLLTDRFEIMLVVTIFHAIFHAPIISFLEAFAMDVLGSEKRKYGRLRVWGSISFILVVVSLGRLMDWLDISLILYLILAGAIFMTIVSAKVPALVVSKPAATLPPGTSLFKRRWVVFLTCGFLMLVSHGAYYGFFSIHLETLGYSKTLIGVAWALASMAEIGVMLNSKRLFERFSLERVLIATFAVAALRWGLLFFVHSPVWILLTQVLHAFTYGAFHVASILYIDRLSGTRVKTLGQAVNNAVQYGLGLMVGFWCSGLLYEHISTFGLFAVASATAVSAGLVFAVFMGMEKRRPLVSS